MSQHIINKFFRGNPMENRKLDALQKEFQKEMQNLETSKGCSRCKKNGLRKKYRTQIQNLDSEK
jgi:hypothetical protein